MEDNERIYLVSFVTPNEDKTSIMTIGNTFLVSKLRGEELAESIVEQVDQIKLGSVILAVSLID